MPLLLALAMCLSLVQVPAFAAEEEPPYEEAPACVCEAYCTEEAVNSSCPVCSENTGLCQGEVPESPEDEEVFPEHEHSFEVLEVISDPTCTEAGEQRLACSICGMETTEAIPAVGHREAVDAAVEPTETAPGLTEGTHCEVCETVLVKQEEIPAAGTFEPEIPAEVLAFLDAVDALYDLAEINDAEAMLSAANEAEELYDALTWEQTGLPEVRERREALDAFWDMVTLEEDVTDAGVTTEEALRAAVANGGEVKLDGDIDLTSTLEIRSTVTLDLNGHQLKQTGRVRVIKVHNGAEFTLNDSVGTGIVTGGSGGVNVEGSFIMNGGTITGNVAGFGGGVFLGWHTGSLIMYGGEISGNGATGMGGGIFACGSGSITIYGGTISGNFAGSVGSHSDETKGGGICSCVPINIYGGTISGNGKTGKVNSTEFSVVEYGGGIALSDSAKLIMTAGEISDNHAKWGGGVTIGECGATYEGGACETSDEELRFEMHGGKIVNNTATETGGGVHVDYCHVNEQWHVAGSFLMTDGEISGNTAKDGGGVYVMRNAMFEMSGGTITGNSAKHTDGLHGGGGVYSAGSFTMSGGEITSNTASESGGGVNIDSGAFIMKDGEISLNTALGNMGGGVAVWGARDNPDTDIESFLRMEGGKIEKNRAKLWGGGVGVCHAELVLQDGAITGNTVEGTGKTEDVCGLDSGGGILLYGHSKMTMAGGEVTCNEAGTGGGIHNTCYSEFIMTGGKVCNNTALHRGDDICSHYDGADSYFEKSTITLCETNDGWRLDEAHGGKASSLITGWFIDGMDVHENNATSNSDSCWTISTSEHDVPRWGQLDSEDEAYYETYIPQQNDTRMVALKAAHGILCKLTVKYVDEQGKEISSTFTEQEKGSGYTVTPEAPDGYVIKEVRGEETGTLDADKEIVVICCQPRVKVTWKDGYTDTPVLEREIPKDTTEVGEHPTDPTRPGYTFTGWGDPVTDKDGNITITAQWVKLHTVTYTDGVPGEEVFADQVFTRRPGEADPDFEGAPVRPGYRFVGWVRTEDEDGNIVYTAQWRRNTAPSGGGNAGGSTGGSTGGGTTTIPDTQTPLDPGTTIIDQEVPLAGAVGLNDADHFAYVIGYEDGTVRPLNNISRAEVATIFFRLMTDDYRQANWSTVNSFTDVKEGDWYNNAISTCARAGALKGRGDGSVFDPNANITRAEFAVIAARFLDSSYVDDGKGDFADTADHWAAKEIRLAAKAGWVNGNGNTFNPDAYITRAEVMTIVNRMLDRTPDKDHMLPDMKKWTDNPEDAWYYEAVQEATNEHDYTRDETAVESWTLVKEHRDWAALELGWAANGGASAPQGETETQGLPDGI